jgi:hypothetical protein
MKRRGALLVIALVGSLLAGCSLPTLPAIGSPGAKLEMTSRFYDDVRRTGRFDTAVYGYDSQDHFTAVLLSGPIENPREAVTLRFFWRPRAALTPIDPEATNTTMHYMVFEDADTEQAVGVYSGAGYLFPRQVPGPKKISADIWQGILTLVDASPGFNDQLGEALLQGDLVLRRDDAAISDLTRRLNVLVTDRLGYPRLVDVPAGSRPRLVTARD